ncbi:hypothetical protein QBC43DRAFT_337249 [Cladorrhinum sp. PSN259]|nr:hypothetical protein QBC43DRAFT_337249 [Cladorrhinum sp. PSN259]
MACLRTLTVFDYLHPLLLFSLTATDPYTIVTDNYHLDQLVTAAYRDSIPLLTLPTTKPSSREMEFRKLSGDEITARGIEHVDDVLSLHSNSLVSSDEDEAASPTKKKYEVYALDEMEQGENKAFREGQEKISGLIDEMDDWFLPIKQSVGYKLAMKEMELWRRGLLEQESK